MKDSQPRGTERTETAKYIKANNERFSTGFLTPAGNRLSISRRIMKDSQRRTDEKSAEHKYIKANNERFSTFTPR